MAVIHLAEAGLGGIWLDVSHSWIWTALLSGVLLGLRIAFTVPLVLLLFPCSSFAHGVFKIIIIYYTFTPKTYMPDIFIDLVILLQIVSEIKYILTQSIQQMNSMPYLKLIFFPFCIVAKVFVVSAPLCAAICHIGTPCPWFLTEVYN